MSDTVASVLAAMISAGVPRTSLSVHRLTDALLLLGWELTEPDDQRRVDGMSKDDILNRIDDPELCGFVISQDRNGVIEYCEDEEHNPFSNRCEAHGR